MRGILGTYRLQLEPGFGFDEAAALADYFARLGVSHVYCSPYLQAAPGSTHGYDVVDPHHVNDELGGVAAHGRFCVALRNHDLGQILDIVPNHMAIGTERNRWWWDVLENGASSRYAAYFDVDWDPPDERFRGTILLPCLEHQYGKILEAGELRLERRSQRFAVRYGDRRFPVAPRSLEAILAPAAQRIGSESLGFIAASFGELPSPRATDRASVERRHRDKQVLRQLLTRLLTETQGLAQAVDEVIAELNADRARLHDLLELQNYRLAFWRMAGRDLSYRRFFDIDTLIGLRNEDPAVFADTHALILRWLGDGTLDGVRIDHVDGLRDPEEYLQRLRAAAPDAWIVVEKILEADETLPESWPADGTTGYDFLNLSGGLFIDARNEGALTDFYAQWTNEGTDYATVLIEAKRTVVRELLGSDLRRVATLLIEVCELHPRHRDHTRAEAEEVLCEIVACFPVYRTYVRAEAGSLRDIDARTIDRVIARASDNRSDLPADLFDFVRDVLCLRARGRLEADFVMRFQQMTGPAMAKGAEDTVFYRFHRFVCLNEVGGDPGRFGVSPEEFHRWCTETQRRRPLTMLATSTHDTKRSEDVRVRLALLSEIPNEWSQAVRRWSGRSRGRDERLDRSTEYLLYQTLVGAWPITLSRALAYMEKAVREAKVHTSWIHPDPDYEVALRHFVERVFANDDLMSDIERFVAPLVDAGRISLLAQTLLKLTAPGVPDIYRGCELWDLSLVDPDNRRPVDWALRRRLLEEIEEMTPEQITLRMDEGLPKLFVIRQALRLRRQHPAAFGRAGSYEPLPVAGSRAHHVVGFIRGGAAATIVPRLVIGLANDWGDTSIALPAGRWRNELGGDLVDGGSVNLAGLLARFPVALLSRQEAAE